jgi:exodeoxyribonuclease VII small subunit
MNAKREKSEKSEKVDATAVPYTEAVRELDEILTEIERADVDLDRLAGRVERASELVKLLKARIRETELKVTRIVEELEEEDVPAPTADDSALRPEALEAGGEPPETEAEDVPF